MKTLLFLVALGFMLIGCAHEGPYVPSQRQPAPEFENTTVVLDREISGLVAVDLQHAERTHQGKLKGMANIRNRTNQDLTLQVQTVFRDVNGFSINDDTSWDTIVLTANETRTVGATSTTPKADRYTIRIRMMR